MLTFKPINEQIPTWTEKNIYTKANSYISYPVP